VNEPPTGECVSVIPILRDALARSAVTVSVAGTSMLPTLRPGDRIIVEACRPEDLRPGEVALVGDRDLSVHRYIGRRCEGLLFKGDSMRSFDPLRCPSVVLGRVLSRVRHGSTTKLRLRPLRVMLAGLAYRAGLAFRGARSFARRRVD